MKPSFCVTPAGAPTGHTEKMKTGNKWDVKTHTGNAELGGWTKKTPD